MSGQERLLDLLTARATEGLSDERSRELDAGLDELTDIGVDDLALAAAAADLALQSTAAGLEPMPAALKQRILEQGRFQLASRRPSAPEPALLDTRFLGWYVAAAILLLALWAPWSSRPEPTAPGPTLAEQRSLLLDSATDVIRVAWAQPDIEAYAQVQGDVVWSNQRQAGFMRLRGLPANRRQVEQYQLWIVDPSRDERPIDGGVFDVPAGVDEVIVPIDAKLRADNPTVFAITLEQPGGVVVSDGPLLVVAAVGA
jgi:anti-sigma-K factor RskA